jgi:hypothetical protein
VLLVEQFTPVKYALLVTSSISRGGEIRCAKLNTLRSDFVYFTLQAVAIANFTPVPFSEATGQAG